VLFRSGSRSRRRRIGKKRKSATRSGRKRSAVRRRGRGRIGRKRCRHFVSLAGAFRTITDPRVNRRRRHLLIDIIVIALCAVIGGAETWKDVQIWGESHHDWLAKFLVLPNGIPSRDTYRRVYDRLCPREFQACFLKWIEGLSLPRKGRVIAIDGKTLRRSMDSAKESPLLHLVSAWATDQNLTLGQVAVDGKSNEITAIPKLLKLIALKGALVTIDAMGCQKEIARQIREARAHYVLALKGNHQRIHDDVKKAFTEHLEGRGVESGPGYYRKKSQGHGREEDRTYFAMPAPEWLHGREEWKDLRSIGMVLEEQTAKGQVSGDVRYFLSSLPPKARQFARAIRRHWSIENSLHWILDVTFQEDRSRMRPGRSTENFAWLRRLAITLLKNEPTRTDTVRAKRMRATWDVEYLEAVLLAAISGN
jgi:predicted transposase YbfD/YdcC